MIELKDICIVLPTHPSGMLYHQLARYVQRFPRVLELQPQEGYQSVPTMRNRVMHEIVLPTKVEWYCFLDNDLRPDQRLDDLFTAPGDIVGAKYVLQNPNAFADPNVVHCGAIRFHRKVIEAMTPPYFQYQFDDRQTKLLACECVGFCRRAVELGFKINRAGFSEHANLRTYCG